MDIRIMIIDDNITNLTVARQAISPLYGVIPVSSGEQALDIMQRVKPNLILLDVEMPGMNGFETLAAIKADEGLSEIPVIFLTARDDNVSELEGLKAGAVDYITKPFSIPLLLQRIEIHLTITSQRKELRRYNDCLSEMVSEKTEIIIELQHAILSTLTDLIEQRDGTTGGHVSRTRRYLTVLSGGLRGFGRYSAEINSIDFDLLHESSRLHDIGKIATPDAILNKPGKLTAEEFEEIKKHPVIGYSAIQRAMDMTRSKDFLSYAATVAISHHEKWNGTGYPYGLSGTDIPFIGRLMAIADVYDALVSWRPYKPPFSHDEACRIIISDAGEHFDPGLVEVFKGVEGDLRAVCESFG